VNKSNYTILAAVFSTNSNYNPLDKKKYTPDPDDRKYTYLCHNNLKPAIGDTCIVLTPQNGFSCVTIVGIAPEDHVLNPKITYKWIVDKVNFDLYDKITIHESK